MKTLAMTVLISLLICSAGMARAQQPAAPFGPVYSPQQLEQMLAPIALYPDALLTQILMAATHPLEVVQAARWSRSLGGREGEDAVLAVEGQDWDASVKSLVAFPQVLAVMDERMDWVQRLGDAFASQEADVMRTVQSLRGRAYAAGNLESSEQVVVQRQGTDFVIEEPLQEVVYVPYYDPMVVYGTWWAPAYIPVYWQPWRGYQVRRGHRGLSWGRGIAVGGRFFYGACDWPRHRVRFTSNRPFYFRDRTLADRRHDSGRQRAHAPTTTRAANAPAPAAVDHVAATQQSVSQGFFAARPVDHAVPMPRATMPAANPSFPANPAAPRYHGMPANPANPTMPASQTMPQYHLARGANQPPQVHVQANGNQGVQQSRGAIPAQPVQMRAPSPPFQVRVPSQPVQMPTPSHLPSSTQAVAGPHPAPAPRATASVIGARGPRER